MNARAAIVIALLAGAVVLVVYALRKRAQASGATATPPPPPAADIRRKDAGAGIAGFGGFGGLESFTGFLGDVGLDASSLATVARKAAGAVGVELPGTSPGPTNAAPVLGSPSLPYAPPVNAPSPAPPAFLGTGITSWAQKGWSGRFNDTYVTPDGSVYMGSPTGGIKLRRLSPGEANIRGWVRVGTISVPTLDILDANANPVTEVPSLSEWGAFR